MMPPSRSSGEAAREIPDDCRFGMCVPGCDHEPASEYADEVADAIFGPLTPSQTGESAPESEASE